MPAVALFRAGRVYQLTVRTVHQYAPITIWRLLEPRLFSEMIEIISKNYPPMFPKLLEADSNPNPH